MAGVAKITIFYFFLRHGVMLENRPKSPREGRGGRRRGGGGGGGERKEEGEKEVKDSGIPTQSLT